MDVVKLSWSGGKDSTAAALLHIQRGDTVKMVYYIPYLTDDIPLIMPQHYNFIMSAADRFRAAGAEVYQAHGKTYFDHVHTIKTKGIHVGEPYGYGLGFGFCNFRDRSKIPALNRFDVGNYDYLDIGIAFDEIDRQSQLTAAKRSILVELRITERQARQICIDNNLLSPVYYGRDTRDGCAICPYAPPERLQDYVDAYPAARDILIDIDNFCIASGFRLRPYHDAMTFFDRLQLPYQYSFFDGGVIDG